MSDFGDSVARALDGMKQAGLVTVRPEDVDKPWAEQRLILTTAGHEFYLQLAKQSAGTVPVWTHKVPPDTDHPVDPHYNGNGLPAFWTCHTCRGVLLLNGAGVPIVEPVKKGKEHPESDMSSQP